VSQALLGKLETEPQLLSLLSDATASKSMALVVSVMRGQRVTDQEPLIADPSRFGIVLCTPDMLLSRLLFAGFGCAHGVMSREAGLAGHDAWLVLDEAHLSDAARNVLEFVGQRNRGVKPFWHTCMTATPRAGLTDGANTLRLGTEDLRRMAKTLRAHKAVRLLDVKKNDLAKKVSSLAEAQPDWKRLIVYVEEPKLATEICDTLAEKYDVKLLTGTMRGLEKDAIDLRRFGKVGTTDDRNPVLVCTSAGEVGLDISADFLITEFTNIERLLQRLGRLNRWGECPKAYGYILKPEDKAKQTKENPKQVSYKATEGASGVSQGCLPRLHFLRPFAPCFEASSAGHTYTFLTRRRALVLAPFAFRVNWSHAKLRRS
jgi:CRISPR-associated endonuclease/helicase Cas3